MSSSIYGIVPLAGNATRMNSIPKFLLPYKIGLSLLDNVISVYYENGITNIEGGVSEMNNLLLHNDKLNKTVMKTKTMAETVYNIVNKVNRHENDDKNILVMPDTFFTIKNEISEMIVMLDKYEIVIMLWKIKDYQKGKVGQCRIENNNITDIVDKDIHCNYHYFWGCIGWKSSLNKYIDPEWETIGNLVKKSIDLGISIGYIINEGNYYDCGTYSEYFTMIKTEN